MEHRWGIRQPLDVGIKLYVGSKPPKLCRLLNASSSGAYVLTDTPLPIMTPVQLALGWNHLQHTDRHRIAAYVVRSDARGIGIEWQDFAPLPVLAMTDAPEPSPFEDSLDRIRAMAATNGEMAYLPRSRSSGASGSVHRGA